jgi:hypothetical protein
MLWPLNYSFHTAALSYIQRKPSKLSAWHYTQKGFGTSTVMPGNWCIAKNIPQSDKFSEGTNTYTLKVTTVICYIHMCCVPGSCLIKKWLPTMDPECTRNLSFSTNNSTVKRNGNYSILLNTMAVRKVSGHFEYLENRSGGLDVTWQPVMGDLTVHWWTVTLPWGQSVGGETSLTELVYCVSIAFTMIEWADQLHQDKAPAPSTALVQAFLGNTSHHPGLSAFLQPRFGSLLLLAFPKVKRGR